MDNDTYISPNKITKQFDVTSGTLRKWAEEGKIRYLRSTTGGKREGKRIYNVEDVKKIFGIKEDIV